MNRVLIFHHHEYTANSVRMAPAAYYLEKDYNKVAVRIYAERVPQRDAKIDIFDDGVSIFKNRAVDGINRTTGVRTSAPAVTEAILSKDNNAAEIAGDFTDDVIAGDSWVHCNLVDAGGGKNFTVQLELEELEGESESL